MVGAALTVAVLALLIGAWAVDTGSAPDRVRRNVTIDARGVGSLSPAELDAAVAEVARGWDSVPVAVRTPGGSLDTTLGAVGVHLDEATVAAAARAVGRSEGFPASLLTWLGSLVRSREVPLSFRDDPDRGRATLAPLEQQNHKDPVEASLRSSRERIELVAATPGATIDVDAIRARALELARAGQRRITIEVGTVSLAPRFAASTAQELRDHAERLADQRLAITVGDKTVTTDARIIRPWITSAVSADGRSLEPRLDQTRIETDLPSLLGAVGAPPVQLAFAVDAEKKVTILEGRDGTRCCAPGSAARVQDALEQRIPTVTLDLTPVPPDHDRAWAEKLGIAMPVGSFTTPHLCCQPRVTNIHLFADTMRGRVIEPGQTLSLNAAVGQRTPEKGFVVDHAIVDGKYEDNVGGGVSQFAATTFNAAFFAGLDIPEYQMHSIFIDRYPYGREATISWEKPDLKIRNNSPFGILVWPTYTDTSLTVTLYSSPWAKGEQTNQTKSEIKPSVKDADWVCTKVVTERTRTFLGDNHTERDTFVAVYQPEEGKKC